MKSRTAERSVIEQQIAEGKVLAPTAGRVLTVPVTAGTVICRASRWRPSPNRISCCGCACRSAMPAFSKLAIRYASTAKISAASGARFGTIRLVYPQIEDGRVVADATVSDLGDYFVGQRIRVWISAGERTSIIVPGSFIVTRFGIDYARVRTDANAVIDVPVQRGRQLPRPDMPDALEILSGLKAGDVSGAAVNLGLSGRLTQATIRSPLTPLFLLAALAVGLLALLTIPREEEPQISVPMVDIRVNADGLKAPDAVELVTKPLEAIVKGIDGVEHVYSQTVDDRVMVTARFLVGTKADDAILRIHEKIRANLDRIPIGIPEPLIVGRGINDVAVVVLTLSPKPEAAARWTDKDLYELGEQAASRTGQDR